jgi:putative RecB family exonuclease
MVRMDHLSASQINLYLLCGLKYKYQYIDKLPKPFKPSALAFGSVMHSALSWIHDKRIKGEEVSLDMVYRIFESDWYVQKLDTEIRYKDYEQELILELLGKEMLDMYLQLPQKELKGSEVHFSVPLTDPLSKEKLPVNLEGFFDLIEADDTITEFKNTAVTMNQEDMNSHIQLTTYGYAFKALFQKPAKGFKVVNFVKKKKPKIEIFETQRNELHYQGFFFLAKSVLKGIETKIFTPRTGYWCKECEYASQCPLWLHLKEEKAVLALTETT